MKPDRPAPVPFRMDPTNPLPRVRVNQSTHPHYYCGSMPVAVGMLTTRGEVVKVNPKSVVLRKPGQSDSCLSACHTLTARAGAA